MAIPSTSLQSGQIYAIQSILPTDNAGEDGTWFLGVEDTPQATVDEPLVVFKRVSSPIMEATNLQFHWRFTDASALTQEPMTFILQSIKTVLHNGPGEAGYLRNSATSTCLSLSLGSYPISWVLQAPINHEGSEGGETDRCFRIKVLFPPICYGLGPLRASLYTTAIINPDLSDHAVSPDAETRRIELSSPVASTRERSQLWKFTPIFT